MLSAGLLSWVIRKGFIRSSVTRSGSPLIPVENSQKESFGEPVHDFYRKIRREEEHGYFYVR